MYPQQMESIVFVIQTFTTNKNVILLGTSRDQGSLGLSRKQNLTTNKQIEITKWPDVM